MTTFFPPELYPSSGEEPTERRAKRRLLRKAMKDRAQSLLSQHDYTLGDALQIPRSVSFAARHGGGSVNIAIRSSADRWIAVTEPALAPGGELTVVDELFVITFKDPKKRDALQLWRFDAAIVADLARQVFKAASAPTSQQWLPLDDAQDASVPSMVGGSLAKRGTLLAEEPVQWADQVGQNGSGTGVYAQGSQAATARLTIEQAKAGLAAQFGVSTDSIKITIEG